MVHRWIRLFFRKGHNPPRTEPPMSQASPSFDSDAPAAPAAHLSEPCPACGTLVDLPADVELGEILYCGHCGAEVEVISRDPLRLDLFEEEEK
jgi:alpha-aminoadipate carrier protein LysW